ncbi:MAG: hypothetical protein UR31_C0016G0007 [Parcubacteria group bacterium GW2011_GWA2_33_14]|uniref:Transcriptional repressor PaaX-like central Cas2-like domain-containing protein n=1 Tax=Candidatus Staskawiczbacteria bacterium RIFCSPHIGHO2_02_FULL_33_16 TaxID=1802204 RepID=A0A1G2HTF8_9BACT|nr:MAG: hypothetical protein UR31_C0016G0007 [Parcubacteria group bacterium GW2011_GWA2_33_14]OGZ65733.1 MAG: hypothetical protein A3D34_03520 [Candidatus Staskawiczbacteria bacterium RIFCSPHIGHO2_02_FULL_33_16]OGZ70012.1 MAG: hypothetical protein A2980_00040 [Candidatus Staskawiczbacteria bacterium RIFCSPLOWO2_01_FULL_33_13]
MNEISKKILLLLYTGVGFSYSYTPGQKLKFLKNLPKEWKKIEENELKKGIKNLYRLDIIDKAEGIDGWITVKPTEKGKLRALNLKLDGIKSKKQTWDRRWRMVAFDIPEKHKQGRDALRRRLIKIGFCELQKSVFIAPYDCREEIILLVKFFRLEKYVRFGELDFIDKEDYFKKVFKLS